MIKKENLRELLVNYFGSERLKLSGKIIQSVLSDFKNTDKNWQHLLNVCFLSEELKTKYRALLNQRKNVLEISS